MTRDEVEAVRTQMWANDFRPIPLCNWDDERLDEPGRGKKPLSAKWTELARENPPRWLRYEPVPWAQNTGALCDGLRPWDFDIDDAPLALACCSRVLAYLGEAPQRFRANSPRLLLLYSAASGTPAKLTLAGSRGKIEILGCGNQFVAHGKHATGAMLEWRPYAPWEISRDRLTPVTEDQVIAGLTELMPLIGATHISGRSNGNGHDHDPRGVSPSPGVGQAEPLRIATALNDIPNDGPPDWEEWNKVGMALWRATGGSEFGCALFEAWSQRNPKCGEEDTARARWDHYPESPPDHTGAGKIFRLAAEARERQPLARSSALGALRRAAARITAGTSTPADEARRVRHLVENGRLRLQEATDGLIAAAFAAGLDQAECIATLRAELAP
jgi:hypothetical protein